MKQLKILFAGLANAGKTSILRVLDDNLEVLPKLTPTPGIEYNHYQFMGLDVSIWDAGGQLNYRNYYIKEYLKYFEDTDLIFYIIDIQDESSFPESINYLKQIKEILNKLKLSDTSIIVLFHKYDPHVQNRQANLRKNIANLRKEISQILDNYSTVFYETSIYESHTLFMAFSEGTLQKIPGSSVLHKKVKEIGMQFHSPASILLTAKGYIYAVWHVEEIQRDNLNKFNRSVIYLAHLVCEKLYPEFISISLTNTDDIAAMIFPCKEQIFIYGILVPKTADIQQIQIELKNKRENLQATLQEVIE